MSGGESGVSGGVSSGGEAGNSRGAESAGGDLFRQALAPHPDEVDAAPAKFGPGRRKGSRNRTSEDLAQLIQQIGGHPVLAMARIQGMTLEEIKGLLGCNRIEAFDRWWKAVCELAPYVASKMPLALAVNGKITSLNLNVPIGQTAGLEGPDAVLALFRDGLARAAAEGFTGPLIEGRADEQESDDKTDG